MLESAADDTGEPLLTQHAVMRLRRMLRLRRDLGVNFAGASVILDLLDRLDVANRELVSLRASVARTGIVHATDDSP
jgi:hypothetical protein